MAQNRSRKVGEYDRPTHVSRTSPIMIAVIVLVILAILAFFFLR